MAYLKPRDAHTGTELSKATGLGTDTSTQAECQCYFTAAGYDHA